MKEKRGLTNSPSKRSVEPSPKKKKTSLVNDSPMSSPLKGPLIESTDANSPSFVARCFYGFKKSEAPRWSRKENSPTKDKTVSNGEAGSVLSESALHLCNGKLKNLTSNRRINEIMSQRVVLSPVKQAVLDTCSLEEFRKMYRNELREIEWKEMTNFVVQRRSSRILKRKEDDEEDYDELDHFPSDANIVDVDEDVSFKIPNNLEKADNDNESDSSEVESDEEECGTNNALSEEQKGIEISRSKAVNHRKESPVNNSEGSTTPPGSQRKFFKTKSPKDNPSLASVILSKGFNLKFVASAEKKSHELSRKKRLNTSPKTKKRSGKKARALFPSQHKETSAQLSQSITTPGEDSEACLMFNDDESTFRVNKESKCTYEVSSARDSDQVSENSSLNDSACSSNESIDLLPERKESNCAESPVPKNSSIGSPLAKDDRCAQDSPTSQKFYPIFGRRPNGGTDKQSNEGSPQQRTRRIATKDGEEQLIIDAGQRRFGAEQCDVCGMIYCQADPVDNATHTRFHSRHQETLKFPGWKKERVVQEYPEDMGRVIVVITEDPKYTKKKVADIYQIMESELGFSDAVPFKNPYQKVFLYISYDQEIAGCCVAEPIKEGYRVIPGDLDSRAVSGQRPWCCSNVSEPAAVGISRLWVSASMRKQGVATRMLDSVRQWFDYGSLIPKHKVAFSDPTPDGRQFAQKYIKSNTFLVYKSRL